MGRLIYILLSLAFLVGLALFPIACGNNPAPTAPPPPTFTPTFTICVNGSGTPCTPTATFTPTSTPTTTHTPTQTFTPTITNTPTITSTPTITNSPTPTPSVAPLYVALGDSISTGYGLPDVSLSFVNLLYQNNNTVYPADSGLDLSTKYPGIQLLNLAIPGTTSFDVINTEMPSIPTGSGSPKFVTLIIGGNELINSCGGTPCDGAVFGCSAAQGTTFSYNFKTRLKTQIIQALQNAAVYPRLQKIVIGNIYDPTDGVGLGAYGWTDGEAVLAQYNQRISETATETGAILVDDYTPFLGHGTQYNVLSNPYYDAGDPTFWYNPSETPVPIHPYTLGQHHLKLLFWPDF